MRRVGTAWTNEFVGKRVVRLSRIEWRFAPVTRRSAFRSTVSSSDVDPSKIRSDDSRSARRKRSPAGNYEFDGRDGASYFLSRATLKITTVDAIYSSQTADRGSWDDTRNSVWTDRRSGVERPRPGKIDSSYASYGANSSFGDELSFRKREGNGRGTEGRGLWPGEGSGRYNGARASIIITRLVFGDKMPRDPIGRTHRPDATRI